MLREGLEDITMDQGTTNHEAVARKESAISTASVEVVVYDTEGKTRPSLGSSDGGGGDYDEGLGAVASGSSDTEAMADHVKDKARRLAEKVTRTTNFLNELKTLSSAIEEQPQNQEDEGLNKDRQIFIRRIVQATTELQDGRDLVLSICKASLTQRQWRLLCDITGSSDNLNNPEDEEDEDDRFGLGLTGFDLDPSVRFFGIDWERVFGRCFTLSMNIKVFAEQLNNCSNCCLQRAAARDDVFSQALNTTESTNTSSGTVDLILVNTILRDLSTIEADVTSHAEAVLHGRLSKSQQRLIRNEQLKNCQPVAESVIKRNKSFKSKSHRSKSTKRPKHSSYSAAQGSDSRTGHTTVSKSKSFRAPPTRSSQVPDYQRYRKNRTADLSKLTLEDSPPEEEEEVEPSAAVHRSHSMRRPLMRPSQQEVIEQTNPDEDEVDEDSDNNTNKSSSKKSKTTKMFQNFSSLFKNIR